MQEQSKKDYETLKKFVHGFLDKRTGAYQSLKTADALCRQAVENSLSKNPEIKKIIACNNGDSLWIKELVVNYILLKMHHHAVLWEIDDNKP